MEAFLLLLLFAGIVGGYFWKQKTDQDQKLLRAQGHVLHLRSGEFPSTCSWCRNTSLAKKLFVYERVDEAWRVRDVASEIGAASEQHVEGMVASVFRTDAAKWRRFCAEKCVKEFLASEHAQALVEFRPCAYCSTRFPAMVTRCTNCGAARA